MERLKKINEDFKSLFTEGYELLCENSTPVLNDFRNQAFETYQTVGGIPYKKEDYIYADLLPLFNKDYKIVFKNIKQGVDLNEAFQCNVRNINTNLVYTLNGWFSNENNELQLPEGVIVSSMLEAGEKHPEILKKYYNQYTAPGANDGLVALNTTFAQDGVFVYVPKNVVLEKPLQIINLLRASADLMSFQRNLIVVEEGASAMVLVCDHTLSDNTFLANNLTEIAIGANAQLEYYQVQNQHVETTQINSVFISQQKDSRFTSNLLTLYGGFVRNNIYSALTEEGCECNLYGMYIMDKKQQVDNFTSIEHIAAHCLSNEHYKGVLDDASQANFSGRIIVKPDAQKTEAYQANNNLLLTDSARVNTKPQLIIDADDVKCSHGATVGQLDEEAMFYLRSRGIGEEESRLMMMFAFAHEIVGKVKLEPLRMKIADLVNQRLRGELSKCHNCIINCK